MSHLQREYLRCCCVCGQQAALAESNLPSVFDSPSMMATEAEDLSMSRSMDDGDEDAERDEFRDDLEDYR